MAESGFVNVQEHCKRWCRLIIHFCPMLVYRVCSYLRTFTSQGFRVGIVADFWACMFSGAVRLSGFLYPLFRHGTLVIYTMGQTCQKIGQKLFFHKNMIFNFNISYLNHKFVCRFQKMQYVYLQSQCDTKDINAQSC